MGLAPAETSRGGGDAGDAPGLTDHLVRETHFGIDTETIVGAALDLLDES
jgi:hypothetical protein